MISRWLRRDVTILWRGVLIFLAVFGVAGYFLVGAGVRQLKPVVHQSAEEALVETAHLLAAMLAKDVKLGNLQDGVVASAIAEVKRGGVLAAEIWGVTKDQATFHIYLTDAQGVVIYDSDGGKDVGQDYSRWRDVRLTLTGTYGARTTRLDPNDVSTAVMYVAAPVKDGDAIIGVLAVGKPIHSLEPFVARAKLRALIAGAVTLLLAFGTLWVAWAWVGRSWRRSKDYVGLYVTSLTRELKEPLTGLRAALQILEDEIPATDRARFLANASSEALRLENMLDAMLALASLEQHETLAGAERLAVDALLRQVVEAAGRRLAEKRLVVKLNVAPDLFVRGEAALLQQALKNLLDNAIDFSPDGGALEWSASLDGARRVNITLRDHGPGAPDYAQTRFFERFYSLRPPDRKTRGPGVGLSFVREVVDLHRGQVTVRNHPDGGVVATLILKAADQLSIH